jgi:hypothetical protein
MRFLSNLLFVFLFLPCFAINNVLENILLNEDETYHATDLYQQLDEYEKNPININTANIEQLTYFIWLSENDLQKILQFRKAAQITSINDLKKLGISELSVETLIPYIRFTEPIKINYSFQTRVELIERNYYKKNPVKFLQKSEITFEKTKIGFIFQKDALEKNYFDFYSYYLEHKKQNIQIILGKYKTTLGQGIMFAPKLGISKSAAASSIKFRHFIFFKPYTSTYEIWDLQGAAFDWKINKKWQIASFGSFNKLTANLSDGKITSFDQTGIHLDLDKKNNVTEIVSGLIIGYNSPQSIIHLYSTSQYFDKEFVLHNNQYYAFGADFFISLNNKPIFGEMAIANNLCAFILGKKWGDDKLQHLLIYRNYPDNFPTWHGKPFSAQNNFSNETGIYFGSTYSPFKQLKINLYFDFWQHPHPRYLEKMPTTNGEQFLQVEYKINKHNFSFRLQHKQKEKQINLISSKIRDFHRTGYRFDWSRNLKPFTLQNRYEFCSEYLPNEKKWNKGELLYSQLVYKHKLLKLIGRLAVYRSKILLYMYENNISGIMQNRILSGDGVLFFVVGKLKLNNRIEIQGKISDNLNKRDQMEFGFQLISQF